MGVVSLQMAIRRFQFLIGNLSSLLSRSSLNVFSMFQFLIGNLSSEFDFSKEGGGGRFNSL